MRNTYFGIIWNLMVNILRARHIKICKKRPLGREAKANIVKRKGNVGKRACKQVQKRCCNHSAISSAASVASGCPPSKTMWPESGNIRICLSLDAQLWQNFSESARSTIRSFAPCTTRSGVTKERGLDLSALQIDARLFVVESLGNALYRSLSNSECRALMPSTVAEASSYHSGAIGASGKNCPTKK